MSVCVSLFVCLAGFFFFSWILFCFVFVFFFKPEEDDGGHWGKHTSIQNRAQIQWFNGVRDIQKSRGLGKCEPKLCCLHHSYADESAVTNCSNRWEFLSSFLFFLFHIFCFQMHRAAYVELNRLTKSDLERINKQWINNYEYSIFSNQRWIIPLQ